jgi:hypothetical protein
MRKLLLILLLFISFGAFAQKANDLHGSIERFRYALLTRDTATMNELMARKFVYTHSNGWQQSRQEIKDDLYNGKIIYKKIDQKIVEEQIFKEDATVWFIADIVVEMEGKPVAIKLKVTQTWGLENGTWKLLMRSSVKI